MTEEQSLIVIASPPQTARRKPALFRVHCRHCRTPLAYGTDRTATVDLALRNRTIRPCCDPVDTEHRRLPWPAR